MKTGLMQFRHDRDEILDLLTTEVKPLPESEKGSRKVKAESDFFVFFETYLPHYASNGAADFHREIVAEIEKKMPVVVPLVIAAPRGFAKSTLVSFAYVIWNVLFKRENFIVIVSGTEDLASDLVEFIKLEFDNNERIRQDFGDMLTGIPSANDFVANGVRVMSRGRKQMVRGFRYRQHRPGLIILDDIEKDEEALSPDVVKKTLETIKDGVYPSLRPGGKLVIVGTVLRKRSVMGTLIRGAEEPYSHWRRKLYRAITTDDKGCEVSLWPERWPIAELNEVRKNVGTLSFNREYQNNPQDDDEALFREEWIRRVVRFPKDATRAAMFIDPSVEGKNTSDFKAIITAVLNPERMKWTAVHAWIKRASIDAMIAAAYRIYDRFRDTVTMVGLEANGFQKVLAREFERAAHDYGYYLPLRQVVHRISKEGRLEKITPLVERGQIEFLDSPESGDMKLLLEQLLYFPSSVVNDDGPDALAGAIELLGEGSSKAELKSGGRRESSTILHGYRGKIESF